MRMMWGGVLEFAEIRFAGVDVYSASEVRVIRRILRKEKLRSWNLEERRLDIIKLSITESFVAVKSAMSNRGPYVNTTIIQPSTFPHPKFRTNLINHMIRNRPLPIIISSLRPINNSSLLQHMSQMRKISNDLLNPQRSNNIHQRLQIFLPWKRKQEHLRSLRFRHQPQTHLRDNAEIRLREDSVCVGTESVGEELPCV